MTGQELVAQYPEAKDNPLKYAVESGMRFMHFDDGTEAENVMKSILLQDFVEYVVNMENEIKEVIK